MQNYKIWIVAFKTQIASCGSLKLTSYTVFTLYSLVHVEKVGNVDWRQHRNKVSMDWNALHEGTWGLGLTFGLSGFTVGMSVPSARCLLESNTFLFFTVTFWQMDMCFLYREKVLGLVGATVKKHTENIITRESENQIRLPFGKNKQKKPWNYLKGFFFAFERTCVSFHSFWSSIWGKEHSTEKINKRGTLRTKSALISMFSSKQAFPFSVCKASTPSVP